MWRMTGGCGCGQRPLHADRRLSRTKPSLWHLHAYRLQLDALNSHRSQPMWRAARYPSPRCRYNLHTSGVNELKARPCGHGIANRYKSEGGCNGSDRGLCAGCPALGQKGHFTTGQRCGLCVHTDCAVFLVAVFLDSNSSLLLRPIFD